MKLRLVALVALTAALRAGAFIFCPLFRRPLVNVSPSPGGDLVAFATSL